MIRKRRGLVLLVITTGLVYSFSMGYGHGNGHGESISQESQFQEGMDKIRRDGPPSWTYNDRLRGTVPEAIFKGPVWENFNDKKNPDGSLDISYKTNYPGYIRIRIHGVNQQFCILKELVSWEYKEPGIHTVHWDGKDASGNIIGDTYGANYDWEPANIEVPQEMQDVLMNNQDHVLGHLHTLCEKEKCGTFTLEFTTPRPGEKISGITHIEGKLTGDFRGYSKTWGFGSDIYVDYKPIDDNILSCGNASDLEPPHFYFDVDTTKFSNGMHLISVVICDHNDHVGTATIQVEFAN
jgi:hypothetical protein